MVNKWCLAVWKEGVQEEEGVIPTNWVRGNFVWWPSKEKNQRKALNDQKTPDETWEQFELIKIKFTSDHRQECEEYCYTTGVDITDDEVEEKRKPKKKVYSDFITDELFDITSKEPSGSSTPGKSKDLPPPPPAPIQTSKKEPAKKPNGPGGKTTTVTTSKSMCTLNTLSQKCSISSYGKSSAEASSKNRLKDNQSSRTGQSRIDSRKSPDSLPKLINSSRRCRSRSHSPIRPRSGSYILNCSRSSRSRSSSYMHHSRFSRSRSISNRMIRSRSNRSRSGSHRMSRSRSDRRSRSRSHRMNHSRTEMSSHRMSRFRSDRRSRSRSHRMNHSRTEMRSRSRSDRINHSSSDRRSRSRSHRMNPRSDRRSRSSSHEFHRSRSSRSRSGRTRMNHSRLIRSRSGSHRRYRSSTRSPSRERVVDQRSRSTSRTRGFPLSDAKFQRRVLYKLVELKNILEKDRGQVGDTTFNINRCNTIEEFRAFDSNLDEKEEYDKCKRLVAKIGGIDHSDHIKKTMKKFLCNSVMSQMNMAGKNKKKMAFEKTKFYSLLKDVILASFGQATEANIKDIVSKFLRFAPDRDGGTGRTNN